MHFRFLLSICIVTTITATHIVCGQAFREDGPDKVRSLQMQNKFDSAVVLSLRIASRARSEKWWPEFIEANTLAVSSLTRLGLYDSALHLAQDAWETARPYAKDHYRKFSALTRQYFTTIHYAGNDDFNIVLIGKMKEYLLLIESIPVKARFTDSLKYKTYEQLGSTYYNLDIFDQSLRYYDSALQLCLNLFGERSLQTAELFSRFNILHINIGDHATAYDFVTQSHDIIKEKVSSTDPLLALAIGRKGEFWIETGSKPEDIRKGLDYLKEAVRILDLPQNKINYFRQVQFHFVFSKTYLKLGDYRTAKEYVDRALALWDTYQKTHGPPAELLTHKAKILLALGDYQGAIKLIDESSVVYATGGYNELARNYTLKGDVYQAQQMPDSALHFYHQALRVLIPAGTDSINYFHPLSISNASPSETLLSALLKRSNMKRKIFATSKKTEYLESALRDYLDLCRYLDQSRRKIINSYSRIRYKERISFIYEEGIECALELYDIKKDEQYLQAAFKLADFRKYSLILDQLEEFRIRNQLGIDPELVAQEKELTDELNIYEQQHHNLTTKRGNDTATTNASAKKVFDLKMKMREFSGILESRYPGYYQLKYGNESGLADPDIREIITNDQLVLQYFAGRKNVYVFSVSAEGWEYFKIDDPELIDSLALDYVERLKHRDQQSAKTSLALYRHLLANALTRFPEKKHLVVIPDGVLGYLPFETLLVSEPASYGAYKTYDYLIRHYRVSYHYSASLMSYNIRQRLKDVGGFLGYAPGVNAGINPLPGTLKEVETIAALMDGQWKQGPEATESSFKKEAAAFNILHLASHNILNDRDPLYSQLFFTAVNDPAEDNILHTYELYTTKLNASLVSLSACNTGAGKLYQGEGIMSLGMGFFYAGVPNLLTSLWDISDQSASDIMTDFYEELQNGNDYSGALHQAKLRYLNESDNITADPFYWGGFIFIGQPHEDAFLSRSAWMVLAATTMIAGLIGYGFFYWKKTRKLALNKSARNQF